MDSGKNDRNWVRELTVRDTRFVTIIVVGRRWARHETVGEDLSKKRPEIFRDVFFVLFGSVKIPAKGTVCGLPFTGNPAVTYSFLC